MAKPTGEKKVQQAKKEKKVDHMKVLRSERNKVRKMEADKLRQRTPKVCAVPRGTARRLRREAWAATRVKEVKRVIVTIAKSPIEIKQGKPGDSIFKDVVVSKEVWKPSFQEFCKRS